MISLLTGWGQARPDVRAAMLTSTRTTPGAALDALSDYDVIYFVNEIAPYAAGDAWLYDFGTVLVLYRDPLRYWHGFPSIARITQYDHVKIDFTICQAGVLSAIVETTRASGRLEDDLDLGYRVLLDKDGEAAQLPPPTYQAYIPTPPSAAEFHAAVESFYHEATYCVKNLWRRDLLPAKYFLDMAMKQHNLLRMLEWRMELEHDWSERTGVYGRGLMRRLPPDLRGALEATYAGSDLAENWTAFYRTVALFRQAAVAVGERLGYTYPEELHRRCMAYFEGVQQL